MIKMIWAQSKNGVIGDNGILPWHLPGDLARFKRLTEFQPVVMGRATWESLGSRPLKNRRNIVMSSNYINHPKVETVSNIAEVLTRFGDCWIIGGAKMYETFMPFAGELYMTAIDKHFEGDTFAPVVDWPRWRLEKTTVIEHQEPDSDTFYYSFQNYSRIA
jgi:dihydrofolate reductase